MDTATYYTEECWKVYLPQGRWYHFFAGEEAEGELAIRSESGGMSKYRFIK